MPRQRCFDTNFPLLVLLASYESSSFLATMYYGHRVAYPGVSFHRVIRSGLRLSSSSSYRSCYLLVKAGAGNIPLVLHVKVTMLRNDK